MHDTSAPTGLSSFNRRRNLATLAVATPFQTEDYLGYWLFYAQRCVAYAFSEALRACCLEHKKTYVVTPPQWGALSLLINQDGQTIGTMSQQRAIDAPTMTGIVKRVEQNGLVERRHARGDRRLVRVYLTDEGREIMRFLPEAAVEFNQIMTLGFSEEEKRDLLVKLQRIIANLSDIGPDTGDRLVCCLISCELSNMVSNKGV